ncbi:MAG: COR domain-containing protein [Pirellulales bacterium]
MAIIRLAAGATAVATKLKQLTSLLIWDNCVGVVGAEAIASGLNGLVSLNIGSNQIGELGAKAIAAKLKQLTSLYLKSNNIGDAGANTIASNLTMLERLDVSNNLIGDVGVKAIASLNNLTSLDLSKNPVKDLSPFAEKIKSGVPVYSDSYYSRTHAIGVAACPLEIPPLEIVKQGPEAVRNYFIERDRQSTVRLYEAKVLIIGEGGAGKTSLLRRLYQPHLNMPEEDETTRGIDIHRHDFQGLHGGPFRLNVWDFGGQHIYHATHQFFLTKSSLYVLVDDTRKDDKCIHDESFKFWFEVVETLSEKSPLIIFQNQKGGRSKDLDLSGIRARFPNVLDVYAGNLEQAEATTNLRDAIHFQVQRLPHVGTEVPAKWAEIRRAVEELSLTKPFISQEEYFKIYVEHLEFDRTKALFLSRYLHDLGVFLHFQDDLLLRKTVILQNQWATDAVFRVLDDEQTKERNGKFSLEDCSRLWHETKYMDMHAELIGLMKKFELCYQLPETGKELWLAPQLLPVSKPAEISSWARASDLVIRFKYSFLPRGLVSRLMVRQHRFVKHLDRCWTHGAFFEHQSGNGQFSQVLVEETLRGNEIELRARGPERKELLSVLVTDLEALNDSFEGLRGRVQKLVPCDCSTCSQTTDPHMYRHDELVGRKAARRRTIGCSRDPYEDVDVIKLLDGITVERLPAWAEKPPQEKHLKIFLASSSELRDDRDAFDLYFRQQNDSLRKLDVTLEIKRWERFLDAMSETRLQEEYNADVRNCDVFVCLIQTKAGKFTEEEFDVAFDQFKRTGRPRIYTYFKSGMVDLTKLKAADLASREAFQKKLGDLGHYTTEYSSIDNLKLQFTDQLRLLLE